ncbi:MAG: hypothetical protein HOE90_18925 [Bacteriovoracaceae bacterium]|nr:hypothetical protein [Bacteriovoracaceae bacterium]
METLQTYPYFIQSHAMKDQKTETEGGGSEFVGELNVAVEKQAEVTKEMMDESLISETSAAKTGERLEGGIVGGEELTEEAAALASIHHETDEQIKSVLFGENKKQKGGKNPQVENEGKLNTIFNRKKIKNLRQDTDKKVVAATKNEESGTIFMDKKALRKRFEKNHGAKKLPTGEGENLNLAPAAHNVIGTSNLKGQIASSKSKGLVLGRELNPLGKKQALNGKKNLLGKVLGNKNGQAAQQKNGISNILPDETNVENKESKAGLSDKKDQAAELNGQLQTAEIKTTEVKLNGEQVAGHVKETAKAETSTIKTFNLTTGVDTADSSEIIGKISDYILQSAEAGKEKVEMQVHHGELGDIHIAVTKTNSKTKEIGIEITAARNAGFEFFNDNRNDLVKHLQLSGLNVADVKLESSGKSEMDFSGQEKDSRREGFAMSQEKEYNSKQGNDEKHSSKRMELWREAKRKMV